MFALDPRMWALIAIVVLLSFGGGYTKGRSDGSDINENKWLRKSAVSAKVLKDKEDQHEKAVGDIAAKLEEEKENAFNISKQRDIAIRSGVIRLSIPIAPPTPAESASAAPADKETRALIDPTTSAALVGITDSGDAAIRNLNSCIDAYEAVRQ